MKTAIILLMLCETVGAQTTPYMVQLLQKPNAISAKAWLQISPVQDELVAGTNIIFYTDPLGRLVVNAVPGGGGGGSGTVTSFSAGSFSPLFNSSVATSTTTPALTFAPISQLQNLFYASPNGGSGNPSFRAISTADLPYVPVQNVDNAENSDISIINSKTAPTPLFKELQQGANITLTDNGTSVTIAATGSGSGTVTSFSSGNLALLFTTTVSTPTTTPALSFTAASESQNLVYASPNGSSGIPSWRALVSGDMPTFVNNVTNASLNNASDITLISSTNYPTVAIKSISAGANTTVTDQGGTNLVIASTGGGGTSLTDFLQYQTNNAVTFRTVASDVADNAATTFSGFGDTLTGVGSGGSAAINTLHIISGAPAGLWAQMRCGVATAATVDYASATFLAVPPYTGYTATYQTFVVIRNTNTLRVTAGFMAATNILIGDVITNQIIFRYSTGSNDFTWHGVVCDGTNEAVVDTGVQLTNDGMYYLAFTKTGSNVVFNVNHANVATISSNAVPNACNRLGEAMAAVYGFETLNGAIKTNLLRYIGYAEGWVVK